MTFPVSLRFKKRPFPFRGPNSSADKKDSFDEIAYDLTALADAINELNNNQSVHEAIFAREYAFSRNSNAASNAETILRDEISSSSTLVMPFSFYRTDGIAFEGDNERHAFHLPMVGTVYPPRNNVLNYFYQKGLLDSQVVVSRDPTVTITEGGDYSAATQTTSDTSNMFNGNNQSYWYRKYAFPPSDDISSISLTITIDVPSVFGTDPNFLVAIPFPGMGLDIDALYDGNADNLVDDSAIENAGPVAFPIISGTTQLKFEITQKNFVEENGMKTFYVGFQEVDLQYVAWDETAISVTPDTTNDNHIILSFFSPEGKDFTALNTIRIDGECERINIEGYKNDVVDTQSTHLLRAQIETDDLISTSLTFDSGVNEIRLTCFLVNDSIVDYLKGIVIDTSITEA